MSNTPQTEAQRLADCLRRYISQTDAEDPIVFVARWTCEETESELLRLDAICDERGANEARMLMRCAEMQATIDQLRAQLAKAVADEREACAKVCDDRYAELFVPEARELAEAIRARSNT